MAWEDDFVEEMMADPTGRHRERRSKLGERIRSLGNKVNRQKNTAARLDNLKYLLLLIREMKGIDPKGKVLQNAEGFELQVESHIKVAPVLMNMAKYEDRVAMGRPDLGKKYLQYAINALGANTVEQVDFYRARIKGSDGKPYKMQRILNLAVAAGIDCNG